MQHAEDSGLCKEDRTYESVVTEEIYRLHNKSVVRLKIRIVDSEGQQKKGYGTGFIAHNSAPKFLVMTCGHLFEEWVEGSQVDVTFHNQKCVKADVMIYMKREEVAILQVDSVHPGLHNVSQYPPVEFFYDTLKEGDPLVMLGYPFSKQGEVDLGSFYGSVTNKAGLTGKLKNTPPSEYLTLVLGDYDGAGGSSGAPVYRGHIGKVVGINVCGGKEVMCFVPVTGIHAALGGTKEVKESKLGENTSIQEMLARIASCFESISTAAGASSGSGQASSSAKAPRDAEG